MAKKLQLRKIKKADCKTISEAFKQQGVDKSTAQYIRYLAYQESGERDVIIATLNEEFAGYLTINWISGYQPFQEKGIPEIVDFNVLGKFQRMGIGTALMDEAEDRIKKVSDYAGIGFGITQDYGAAQILYFNRNYKPDGRGLVKDSKSIQLGEIITIDHSIALCLTKKL